ncbi:MAG: GNAT family N-acetyltransferase [Lachnospiraceae bacterium]|nr:GNAT family N-acetyltransferase [Lachnospiraceae bacterium]
MITYRKATEKDIPDLIRLRKTQLSDEGQDITSMDIDDEMHRYFTDAFASGRFTEFLAEDEGEIVGTGALIIFDFPPSYANATGRRAYIANMYTAKSHRRRGIAHEMISRCKQLAFSQGVTQFFLIASTMGKPVYESVGFHENPTWLTL